MTENTPTAPDKPEEKKTEEKPAEEVKPAEESAESSPLIDATNMAAERMEKATIASNAAAKRLEKVSSDLTLQGKGVMAKPTPAEKDPKEYGKSIMEGKIPEKQNE